MGYAQAGRQGVAALMSGAPPAPAAPCRIGKVFTFLGLSVGVVTSETKRPARIEALAKDVTYITGRPSLPCWHVLACCAPWAGRGQPAGSGCGAACGLAGRRMPGSFFRSGPADVASFCT